MTVELGIVILAGDAPMSGCICQYLVVSGAGHMVSLCCYENRPQSYYAFFRIIIMCLFPCFIVSLIEFMCVQVTIYDVINLLIMF